MQCAKVNQRGLVLPRWCNAKRIVISIQLFDKIRNVLVGGNDWFYCVVLWPVCPNCHIYCPLGSSDPFLRLMWILLIFLNCAGGRWRHAPRLRPRFLSPPLERSSVTPSPMEGHRPTPRRTWHRAPWTSKSRCLTDTRPWSLSMGGNYDLVEIFRSSHFCISLKSGPIPRSVP